MDDTQRIVKCGNLQLHSPGAFFKVSVPTIGANCLIKYIITRLSLTKHVLARDAAPETLAPKVPSLVRWEQKRHQTVGVV